MRIARKTGVVVAGAAVLTGLSAPMSAATPTAAGAAGTVAPRSGGWYSQRDHFDDGDKGGISTHLYLQTDRKYFVAATFYADGEWLYIKPNTSPYMACVTIELKGPDHTLCVGRNSHGKKNLRLPENKKYTLVLGLIDTDWHLRHHTSLGGGRT